MRNLAQEYRDMIASYQNALHLVEQRIRDLNAVYQSGQYKNTDHIPTRLYVLREERAELKASIHALKEYLEAWGEAA